jgi:response regulator RpfG family c-di-GMP phosphodiesterase
MHDTGEIGIHDATLKKPRNLTSHEWGTSMSNGSRNGPTPSQKMG